MPTPKDIYVTYTSTNGVTKSVADIGVVKPEYLDPKDYGAGYYSDDLQHPDLIKRLLMYGEEDPNDPSSGVCIPHGDVWGVCQTNDVPFIDKAKVGLKGMNRNPKH